MSLNFGYSRHNRHAITPMRSLHYQTYFKAISKTMSLPYPTDAGHNDVIFCLNHNENAKFTILTHSFDADNTITTLRLRWFLKAYMHDGTKSTVGIANVNYSDSDIIRVDDTFFLNREFKLKDVIFKL